MIPAPCSETRLQDQQCYKTGCYSPRDCNSGPQYGDLCLDLLKLALSLFESLQRVILQSVVLQYSPDVLHLVQCNGCGHNKGSVRLLSVEGHTLGKG